MNSCATDALSKNSLSWPELSSSCSRHHYIKASKKHLLETQLSSGGVTGLKLCESFSQLSPKGRGLGWVSTDSIGKTGMQIHRSQESILSIHTPHLLPASVLHLRWCQCPAARFVQHNDLRWAFGFSRIFVITASAVTLSNLQAQQTAQSTSGDMKAHEHH